MYYLPFTLCSFQNTLNSPLVSESDQVSYSKKSGIIITSSATHASAVFLVITINSPLTALFFTDTESVDSSYLNTMVFPNVSVNVCSMFCVV